MCFWLIVQPGLAARSARTRAKSHRRLSYSPMTSLDFDMPIALAGCVDQTAGADLRGIPWYASALAISWPVDAMEREAARSLQRAGPGMMAHERGNGDVTGGGVARSTSSAEISSTGACSVGGAWNNGLRGTAALSCSDASHDRVPTPEASRAGR